MRVGSSLVALAAVGCLARGLPAGPDSDPRSESKLTALVGQLTAERPKAVEQAQEALRAMGAEVVPLLFDTLLRADWTLKPRLLQVLVRHGQEFAGETLLSGDAEERNYAALIYELRVEVHTAHPGTPEYRAMCDALVRGLKSEDKNLRALSALAIVFSEDRRLLFANYYELVPALIASFDVPIILDRGLQPGPWNVPFWAISVSLDDLVGDRLAYFETEPAVNAEITRVLPDGVQSQHELVVALAAAGDEIGELRGYWLRWWRGHSHSPLSELGAFIIDRNLTILTRYEISDPAHSEDAAYRSLRLWTGVEMTSLERWTAWWNGHRVEYRGPIGNP